MQLVTFRLGDETFGIEIKNVHEIIRWQEVTRIPRAPAFLEGVIDLRGNVVPVLDLRRRFGTGAAERGPKTRIVVVRVAEATLGLVVDSVAEVLKCPPDRISAPPSAVAGVGREFLRGICRLSDRLVVLLDVDRILEADEAESLTSLAPAPAGA